VSISTLAYHIFNGIQFGILIALLATGLSLIFGMLGIVNFSHGSLYMLGAYLTWTVLTVLPIKNGFWLALIASFLLMVFVGFCIERLLLRRLYDQAPVYGILLTFGLLLFIQQGVVLVYGSTPLQVNLPISGLVNLGLFYYPTYRFFTMVIGLVIILAVWFFVERSSLGATIRACAEDPETAKTLGINSRRVYAGVFALGAALAGVGGALHMPMIGGLQPTIGGEIVLICFIVVVIGGLGSIRGALLGGCILGVIRGLAGILWAPGADVIMYMAMGVILLFRPQGLLGVKTDI
jgi:branched-chain amino acid transport system permease protein